MAYNPKKDEFLDPPKGIKTQRSGARVPRPTFPPAPVPGDLFFETDTRIFWVWDGVIWAKLSTDPATQSVATAETDAAGGGFTDLATVGPTVTVNVGSSGSLLVTLSCGITPGTGGNSQMGFALSGANTLAASSIRALIVSVGNVGGTGVSGSTWHIGASFLLTGLNAGSTTVTAKYNSLITTGTYYDRTIIVQSI
jgi:hypothetical protein